MRKDVFSISLVGYTNAGKSTLFNALTKAGTYAADQLFATLDTTSRRMYLPEVGNVVISDTVGFIRDLPHQLVEAFRATLDETVHADLLLHVVDAASPVRNQQIAEVEKVLAEIGADKIPVILVMNKIDQLPEYMGRTAETRVDKDGRVTAVYLSAKTGLGLDLLRSVLTELARDTDKIEQNDDLSENLGSEPVVERPASADYPGGLSSSIPTYSPRDV
jgi:GTP-binding protein HflX